MDLSVSLSERYYMKRIFSFFCLLGLILLFSATVFSETRLRMSTTTSTENSGLLKVLLPPFEKANNCRVDVISVGTGKALKLGENGDVDVVLVHSRPAEDKFVAEGYGIDRRDVMYNDYVLVGPKNDPAKVKEAKTAVDAFKRLASGKADFISRGDDSGTDKQEKELWKAAGIKPKNKWYIEAGQGMGPVLQMAFERNGYTLADRGTFYAYEKKIDLAILFEGDKALFNPYGVIAVNPKRHPNINYDLATKFIDYITGTQGRQIIADFKVEGKQLFFPTEKDK